MNKFWKYLAHMLRYKRELSFAFAAALLDSACRAGGMGTLAWVIDHFLKQDSSIKDRAAARLAQLHEKLGVDLTALADAIPADKWSALLYTLGFILVLAFIGSVARYTHAYLTLTVSLRTILRIRKMVFTRLVHLPLALSTQEKTAELVSRVVRDTQTLSVGFNALTGRAVSGVLGGVAMLIVALFIDWKLTAIFIAVVPAVGILIRGFGKKIKRASKKALRASGVMLGALTESLQALRVVKVHHAEGYERRRFNRVNRKVLRQQLRARAVKALSSPVIEMMSMIALMAVVMIAAWGVFYRDLDPTTPIKVLAMLAAAAGSFRTLTGLNNNLQEAAAAAEHIDEVLAMPVESTPRSADQRRRQRLPRHQKSVRFDNVSFTYPGSERPVLREVDFTVPHGAVCAIVGANGSGKSTLLGLLPRLYEPDAGRVIIDDIDVATRTLRSVRQQMAVVTQDTVLFDGSIAENILYGSRHATREQVIDAAKRAHAHDFIAAMPQGYDSEVGERGQRLSGGQRQRIAIARAILRDPAILILDEATSQIDADSEANITAALAEFTRDRTTFVIAHRLSTVVDADMIVVMVDGCVAAIGRHADLLASSDAYRTLCRTQLHGLSPKPEV